LVWIEYLDFENERQHTRRAVNVNQVSNYTNGKKQPCKRLNETPTKTKKNKVNHWATARKNEKDKMIK
jgi:hypothetical protein